MGRGLNRRFFKVLWQELGCWPKWECYCVRSMMEADRFCDNFRHTAWIYVIKVFMSNMVGWHREEGKEA